MLTIRSTQLATFTVEAQQAFARGVLDRARTAGVGRDLADEDALRRVMEGIDSARRLGLLGPSQAERYAVLGLRYGARLEQQPWARTILWNARLTIDERLERLEHGPAR